MGIAGSDCIQYFAGKLFGRTKIVPKISPNKSLEGYLAGIALCNAIYLGWLADYSVLSFTQGAVYVNGMLLAGILGDLFISWWKRNHSLKDTSSLLLAHGGFLDRSVHAPRLQARTACRCKWADVLSLAPRRRRRARGVFWGRWACRLDSHIGAWVWSVGFLFYNGIKLGTLFTPMDYDQIIVLIAVTWMLIWGHFFASRLF